MSLRRRARLSFSTEAGLMWRKFDGSGLIETGDQCRSTDRRERPSGSPMAGLTTRHQGTTWLGGGAGSRPLEVFDPMASSG
jgi:hypothetical protein